MKRFVMYRRNLEGTKHTELQKNSPDEPQFEGCVFSDGRVAVRWLTPIACFSVWDNFGHLMHVHGHPEYDSELVWIDENHNEPSRTDRTDPKNEGSRV